MHLKRSILLPILAFILISLGSCSEYQKVLKGDDTQLKFESAIAYYEKGDYFRALQLLDELMIVTRGTSKASEVYYYYAYCHYGQGEFLLASYHFRNYAKTFPNSDKVEECFYMSAYCQYMNSADPSLDQTSTLKAINDLQLFINLYPKSERVEKCNELIDELRAKLEKKDYDIAQLYFKTMDYRAAVVAFRNVMKDYPSTKYREECLFYIMKSYYLFASNSIEAKQAERYEKAVGAYKALLTAYPATQFKKEADQILKSSNKALGKNI